MHFQNTMAISVGQSTEAGAKPVNEDCVGVRIPEGSLLATKGIAAVIADGVSAASAGLEAAEMCVQGFLADYYSTPESWQVKTSGHRIVGALNSWLTSQSRSQFRDEHKGYVSTFTAVVFKSRSAHIFHVGDTRIARLRQGGFERLTTDHSSRISEDTCYLTRAMGLGMELKVDYRKASLEVGDVYILTTDGVHDFVHADEITKTIVDNSDDLDTAAETIVGRALANGSGDNLSCVIIRVDALPDGDQDEVHRRLKARPFPPDLDPGMTIDGLRIESVLSASKSSQLYLVRDQETKQQMVMKTPSVNFQDDPAYIERFLMEEWIGRRVDHPHLVKLIRGSKTPKFLYFLIEHVKGASLGSWIQNHAKRPDTQEVVRIIREVTEGVRALHRKETLHQDIKPDNIMLDEKGRVKLIDYGSCQVASIREIEVPYDRQSALGTVDFSAPEYRLHIKPTTKADQFSIAMLAYHMLTGGKEPYGPKWEKASSLRDFSALTYTPSFKHQPMVPYWMDGALKKALSLRPENRYDTLSEFVHDLEQPNPRFIETRNLPLLERDPVRFWKWTSLVLLVALVVALLWR
ncbi:MAG: bifunctional protein-serine/threonine kinase/phosphatase [Akkermansiaceae bacterium]|nr:bifunctional protein-serine/threonine kinase/phosphatase [Akkermansiaceae bacterium]